MTRTATAKKKTATKKTARKTGSKLNKAACLEYLRQMMEIRFFEEKVFELLGKDIIKGASHLYAGQEATAVGAIAAITDDDLITSTHRGHEIQTGASQQDDGRAVRQINRLLSRTRRVHAHSRC